MHGQDNDDAVWDCVPDEHAKVKARKDVFLGIGGEAKV